MGRSSTEQARQNWLHIITGASHLFRERGVEAVSVADIMAAAGMTAGGFYKHFASKEALVEEAAALAFDTAAAQWVKALAGDDPDRRGVRAALVAQYLRPDAMRRCPVIAFAPYMAGTATDAPARKAYDKGTAGLLEIFSRDPGAHVAPDPNQAEAETLLLFAAMIGARVLGEAAGDVERVRAVKKAVIEVAETR